MLVKGKEVVPTDVWVVSGPVRGVAYLFWGLGMNGHAIPNQSDAVHRPRHATHMIPPSLTNHVRSHP
jgi:putative copper export protein